MACAKPQGSSGIVFFPILFLALVVGAWSIYKSLHEGSPNRMLLAAVALYIASVAVTPIVPDNACFVDWDGRSNRIIC